MKNEKENYDSKEYLYKANMKQINYSRYFDVYSDNDSTKYEPEKYSVLNSSTKELKLELIINEENQDRKSTRLNSSHVSNSYAVFCLKKKKITETITKA